MADAPALDATDSARDLATEHGIDLDAAVEAGEITSTGADGRVTKPDVQKRVDELADAARAKADAERAEQDAARQEAERAEADAEAARREAEDAKAAQRAAEATVAADGTADFTLAEGAQAGTVYLGSEPRLLTHGRRLRLPAGDPTVAALVERGDLVRA